MFIEAGLIAMAMVAGQPQPAQSGSMASPAMTLVESSFQLRVITVDGLGWRSTAYPRLVPVARRGTSTVWTTDKALANSLEAASNKEESASATASLSGESSDGRAGQIYFIPHANRFADGPINQATAVAYTPEVASIEEGTKAHVSGRKLDQGVLATVQIEDRHVEALYSVSLSETLKPAPGDVVKTANGGAQGIATNVQVPQVSYASVGGEWLIPNDGVILISLGIHTVADDLGKAVVRERLAILEVKTPGPMPAQTIAPGSQTKLPGLSDEQKDHLYPTKVGSYVFPTDPVPEGVSRSIPPVTVASLVTPAIPSRSMPEAVDAQGNVVDLPPLPEGYASLDLDRIKPDPRRASPQAPHAIPVDSGLARTSFVPVAEVPVPLLKNGDPVSFLPLNCFVRKLQNLGGFEDYAVIVSTQEPGEPQGAWIKIVGSPKCDDKECQAEAAEAQKLLGAPAKLGASVSTEPGRMVVNGNLPTAAKFSPTFDAVLQGLNRLALSTDCDIETATKGPSNTFSMTITMTSNKDDEACKTEGLTKPTVVAHCDNGADDVQLVANGPTSLAASFAKVSAALDAIKATPVSEVNLSDAAALEDMETKFVAAIKRVGVPVETEEDKSLDLTGFFPQPLMRGLENLGFLVGVEVVDGSPLSRLMEKLAPSEKTAEPVAPVPAKVIDCPVVEPMGMTGLEAKAFMMARLMDALFADGGNVAMKFNPTDHPAVCKAMEKDCPGMKPGVSFDFDIASLAVELPTAKYMNDDVKYLQIVEGPKIDTTPASVGCSVNVKNPDGTSVIDCQMNLSSVLKTPGKTETMTVPLAGNFALELKATIVPIPAKPAAAKP